MYRQMEKIDQTTGREKRKQLLDQYWKPIEEQIFSMRMIDGGMIGHGTAGGAMIRAANSLWIDISAVRTFMTE
jgi:hypothetical protein